METWANSGFEYDALGRLIKATLADGTIILYSYDATGNRTQVNASGGPPPTTPPFNATINVTSAGANLRSLADAAGYTGAQPATITFNVPAGYTLLGTGGAPNGGVTIDTGSWPASDYAISLQLLVAGKVYGGGGAGGAGASGAPGGQSGGQGGDAIYCRLPIAITVASGGEIKGGGGGGGGGTFQGPNLSDARTLAGGGGGGGFPNGAGAAGGNASAGSGSVGTNASGGAGGSGQAGLNGRKGGDGGSGGGGGLAGSAGGAASSNTSGMGAGGAAGYAIRKNGHAVTVLNGGVIAGTQA